MNMPDRNLNKHCIVIVYKTLGPYHVARLSHLEKTLRSEGFFLEVLALAGRQEDYSWIEVDANRVKFSFTTLFPEQILEHVPILTLLRSLYRYLIQKRPKILFVSSYSSFPMVFLVLITRLKGGHSVIMSDSTWYDAPRNALKEGAKRIAVKLLYSAALVSGERAHSYMRHLGIPKERIVNGCDVVDNQLVSRFVADKQIEKHTLRPDLLCVARFIPQKNHFRLIEAYSLYRRRYASDRPLSLTLCGSGPLEQKVRKHAKRFGAPGIRFAGFIQPPELFSYFAAARALVLPSISETWGLVVNEALAGGLPVLVSHRCGCVPELVQEGRNGWTFNPLDVVRLAQLIARVESLSEQEYNRMRSAGQELISQWDLELFSTRVLTLTKMLLNQC